MPHKRAKRCIREQQRSQRKEDLPPSVSIFSSHDIPKSAARILNAESVQKAWREKRKADDDDGKGGGIKRKKRKVDAASSSTPPSTMLKIQPGEALSQFNRRVEDDLRPLMRTAMHSAKMAKRAAKSNAVDNKKAKAVKDPATPASPTPEKPNPTSVTKTEFAKISSSAPRRLNDIALAPPELLTLPRKAKPSTSLSATKDGGGGREGVVSNAQKQLMELEREKAIQRYRALKEGRLSERTKNDLRPS